jgi:hypothetical protein
MVVWEGLRGNPGTYPDELLDRGGVFRPVTVPLENLSAWNPLPFGSGTI